MQSLEDFILPNFFEDEDQQAFEECESRTLAENSFYEFVKQAWHTIEGDDFSPGWHIEVICEHLECVFLDKVDNLIVNVPPRTSKSTLVSCMFAAWVWIHRPDKQFLVASCSRNLAQTNSMKCNQVISSKWYQKRWGNRFKMLKKQNNKTKFQNDKHGYYLTCTTGGSSLGLGGHYLIMDDPNPAEDFHSSAGREARLLWYSTKFSTRANRMKSAHMILVQQRIHMSDCSGFILDGNTKGRWVHLMLPMYFSRARRCKTIPLPGTKTPWEDPRTKEGELLWPDHMPADKVEELADTIRRKGGEYSVAGQFQQQPFPEADGILKRKHFVSWKSEAPPTNIDIVIASWDTAFKAKESSCYSALTVWGVFKAPDGVNSAILLNMWRGKLEFPELQELAVKIHNDYRDTGSFYVNPDGKHTVDITLVEDKATGSPLIQSMRRAGINAIGFNPEGDKDERASIASVYLNTGQVYLPTKAPHFDAFRDYAKEFADLCAMFPAHDARDAVDTFSQAFIFMSRGGYLRSRLDPKRKKPLWVQNREAGGIK